MALIYFTSSTLAKSSEVNSMFASAFTAVGLNLIRMMQDRSVDFSAGQMDWWGEAYIDLDGRNNSVQNNTLNKSVYDYDNASFYGIYPSNPYDENSRDTGTIDTGKWTHTTSGTGGGTATAVISNKSFVVASSSTNNTYTSTLTSNAEPALDTSREYFIGGRFSLTTSGGTTGNKSYAKVSFGGVEILNEESGSQSGSAVTRNDGFLLHIRYSGGNWEWKEILRGSSYATFSPSDSEYILESETIEFSGANASGSISTYFVGYGVDSSTITSNIPTGTFSDTISSAIGVPLIEDWETDADIQYKLTGTGGAEDTGWLSCSNSPSVSTFTAFTAEPDTLIIRLVPKSSSPTIGYPSIKGFAVRAE